MDLRTIEDLPTLEKMVLEVINESPDAAGKIKGGDEKPLNFLVGRVMNRTGGKADARKVREILRQILLE
jgi:aspartyl-tRNA(Asn)/glutamyl-tRNA(Gln) amidotransferase subunit B